MPSDVIQVLLVEDNMGDAGLIYQSMEEALPGQFQMTHVRRLDEALEHLWKETCHVVLLDLGLPDSHGIDTLVLARAQAPGVAIVVLTGFQDEALGDRALKEGAQDYLVKGQVDSKQLSRSVRYAISRKAVAEALLGEELALANADVLRCSRQRMIESQERIRRDAAASLRDGVHESLLAMRDHLDTLLKAVPPSDTTRRLSILIGGLNLTIEKQMAELGRQLYPTELGVGLCRAFDSFHDRFGEPPNIEIDIDKELLKRERADRDCFSEQLVLTAYRIAEEALINVLEHAKAAKVVVRLELSPDGRLRLTIQDDGQGFDSDAPACGLGIGMMQDYAEAMDGGCSIRRDSGTGTIVTADLPLSRTDDEYLVHQHSGARTRPHFQISQSQPVAQHLESSEGGSK
jgi:signal transduction histidine kinase